MTLSIQDLVGFILPPVIDLINFKISNTKVRFWVSVVICLAVATGLNFNKLVVGDIPSLLGSISLVFLEAQVVYKQYWSTSELRSTLSSKLIK